MYLPEVWRIRDGKLFVNMNRPGLDAWLLYPRRDWTDYALECEYQHESSGLFFLFRLDLQAKSFYYLSVGQQQGSDKAVARFCRCGFLEETLAPTMRHSADCLASCPYVASRTDVHRLRITVQGSRMRASLDGREILTAVDDTGEGPKSGGVGIGAATSCFAPCKAVIHDLRVVPLE
jgi:hypothetical protein